MRQGSNTPSRARKLGGPLAQLPLAMADHARLPNACCAERLQGAIHLVFRGGPIFQELRIQEHKVTANKWRSGRGLLQLPFLALAFNIGVYIGVPLFRETTISTKSPMGSYLDTAYRSLDSVQ